MYQGSWILIEDDKKMDGFGVEWKFNNGNLLTLIKERQEHNYMINMGVWRRERCKKEDTFIYT